MKATNTRQNSVGAKDSAIAAFTHWVVALLLAFFVLPASACECGSKGLSIDERIARASYVFRSVVTGARVVREGQTYVTRISLGDVLPYKGGLPPFHELVSHGLPTCGVIVSVPEAYWFFVGPDGVVNRCSGALRATQEDAAALDRSIWPALLASQDADNDDPLGYGESLSQRSNFGFGLALVVLAVLTVLTTTLKCIRASRDVDQDRPS